MAWEDFLNHKCTIYHLQKDSGGLGYGVVDENIFCYPETAEEKDMGIPCHFSVKSGTYTVGQKEPLNEYGARMKLSLPFGTDIRINDKVVDLETGFMYIAELPREVQDHHMIVYVHRHGSVREAL